MLVSEATDHRYEIVKILGQGASATVYLARHLALGEMRVLKILHHDMMMDSKRRAKFLLEAQVSAHLKHPAIVQVFDVTHSASKFQIEMENIEGQSLRQELEKQKAFPLSISLAIIYGILEGMAHAHSAKLSFGEMEFDGVIHRDLKPENIMLRKNGQPVICDFGVAKVGADLMTMTQHISGSVAYMAPERLRGELSTRSIDVFALGVMFFELHKGFRPFNGNNKTQVLENILRWKLVDLDVEWADSDKAILEVIKKAMSRDPLQRYQDAAQMLAALRPIYKLYHGDAPAASVIHDYLTRGHFTTAEFRALIPEEVSWKSRIPILLGSIVFVAVAAGLFLTLSKHQNKIEVTSPLPSAAAPSSMESTSDQASTPTSSPVSISVPAPKIVPTLEVEEKKIRDLPVEQRQQAYFALAKTYLDEKYDAGNALLLVNKALDFSFHPTIALLKTQILIDQDMGNLAENELARIQPWLPKMTRENQAQYYWLYATLQMSRYNGKNVAVRRRARAALNRYISMQPQTATDNLNKAHQLLTSLQ